MKRVQRRNELRGMAISAYKEEHDQVAENRAIPLSEKLAYFKANQSLRARIGANLLMMDRIRQISWKWKFESIDTQIGEDPVFMLCASITEEYISAYTKKHDSFKEYVLASENESNKEVSVWSQHEIDIYIERVQNKVYSFFQDICLNIVRRSREDARENRENRENNKMHLNADRYEALYAFVRSEDIGVKTIEEKKDFLIDALIEPAKQLYTPLYIDDLLSEIENNRDVDEGELTK